MKDKCVAIIEKQIIMKHNVNWVTNSPPQKKAPPLLFHQAPS